jgi:hypothetical protein
LLTQIWHPSFFKIDAKRHPSFFSKRKNFVDAVVLLFDYVKATFSLFKKQLKRFCVQNVKLHPKQRKGTETTKRSVFFDRFRKYLKKFGK